MTEKQCIFKKLSLKFTDSLCTASEGTFDIAKSIGKLFNDVVYQNPKFSLKTESLTLDFNKKKINSESKTVITFNKKAELTADEFEYNIQKSTMRLTKNVKLKIMNLQNKKGVL